MFHSKSLQLIREGSIPGVPGHVHGDAQAQMQKINGTWYFWVPGALLIRAQRWVFSSQIGNAFAMENQPNNQQIFIEEKP